MELVPVEVGLSHSLLRDPGGQPEALLAGGRRGTRKKGKSKLAEKEEEILISVDVEETFFLGSGHQVQRAGKGLATAPIPGRSSSFRQQMEARGHGGSRGKKVLTWEVKGSARSQGWAPRSVPDPPHWREGGRRRRLPAWEVRMARLLQSRGGGSVEEKGSDQLLPLGVEPEEVLDVHEEAVHLKGSGDLVPRAEAPKEGGFQ